MDPSTDALNSAYSALIWAVSGGVLILIVSIVINLFFSHYRKVKVSAKDGSIELDKGFEEKVLKKVSTAIDDNIKNLNLLIEEVMEQSIDAGFKISNLKGLDLINLETSYVEKNFISLKGKLQFTFIELLKQQPLNAQEISDNSKVFDAIATIFVSILSNALRSSFIKDNWTEMSELDFKDLVDNKVKAFVYEWRRVVDYYYPSKLCSVPPADIVSIIDPKTSSGAYAEFKDSISSIYCYAKDAKEQTKEKINKIRKGLKELVLENYKKFANPNQEVVNGR